MGGTTRACVCTDYFESTSEQLRASLSVVVQPFHRSFARSLSHFGDNVGQGDVSAVRNVSLPECAPIFPEPLIFRACPCLSVQKQKIMVGGKVFG